VTRAALRDELLGRGGEARTLAVRVALPAREGAALQLYASGLGTERLPGTDRFYWEQPTSGRAIAAAGALHRIEEKGAARFVRAATAHRALLSGLVTAGVPAPAWAGPLLVGGFAFDGEVEAAADGDWVGFAPLSFVLPEMLYVRDGDRAWLTAAIDVDRGLASSVDDLLARVEARVADLSAPRADDVLRRPPAAASEYCARPDRPHERWLAGVEAAVGAMGRGELEKVVLARSLGVRTDVPYDTVSVLAALRGAQRACTTFAIARGARTFLGASPERLVRLDGDRLSTAALAGSAPRGRSPEEDARIARTLRESKKEQEEHAFVVREIAASLGPLCAELALPESPRLLALDGIQHLETPIEAQLRTGLDPRPGLFDLIDRLHPTPAVCGTPRERAIAWLRRHEALERGWYAGGVGFVDATGGGEIGVALRSGVLAGCSARLYAGAGLVAASRPEAELAETRLKLRTLLSQLTEI
jgi:isochorismate synthase